MYTYIIPIKTALITFPFIAFVFTFPFAIYQYRKHGYINKFRVFILYSFLLYLIVAYYLVILPLPKTRDVLSLQKPGTQYYQLIPFNFISDILRETNVNFKNPLSYINLLKERAFLQVAFNAILLTPLGIYLRYYFKKDLKKTILICFLTSLFFEFTQLTALYGIYNAPYRIFDVDDLIINTLGGILGYTIEPIFTILFPKAFELDMDVNLDEMRVSYFRRFFAYGIDLMVISFVPYVNKNIIIKAVVIFVYFIVIVYLTNGKTLGKSILRIKVKGKGERLTFREVFKRYGILYFGVFGINLLLQQAIVLNKNNFLNYISLIVLIILMIIDAILFLHLIISMFKKDRLFYEKYSGTRNVIIK